MTLPPRTSTRSRARPANVAARCAAAASPCSAVNLVCRERRQSGTSGSPARVRTLRRGHGFHLVLHSAYEPTRPGLRADAWLSIDSALQRCNLVGWSSGDAVQRACPPRGRRTARRAGPPRRRRRRPRRQNRAACSWSMRPCCSRADEATVVGRHRRTRVATCGGSQRAL